MKMNLRSWYSGGAFLARIQKQICNLRSYGLFTIKEMEDPKKRIIAIWQCHPFVLLTEMICSDEKWRHQHWFSFNVIHVRRLLSVARFCSENRWSKILFLNPFPEKKLNWWISKMRIWIWSEESTHSVDYKDSWSVYGFAQKQAKSSLNSEIPIWIFLKKLTLKLR